MPSGHYVTPTSQINLMQSKKPNNLPIGGLNNLGQRTQMNGGGGAGNPDEGGAQNASSTSGGGGGMGQEPPIIVKPFTINTPNLPGIQNTPSVSSFEGQNLPGEGSNSSGMSSNKVSKVGGAVGNQQK